MLQIKKTRINQDKVIVLMKSVVLMIGVVLIVLSALNGSSFLAIFGVTIIFWGAIFLYVTPSKYVPLTLLNASAEAAADNIEQLIFELNLSERGVYLPPKNLRNIESSLVFIPKTPLPTPEETNEKQLTNQKTGAFITPPGTALSRLFEEELGFSFTKTDLNQIQNKLPKLLVEGLELAESAEIQIQGNVVTLEITGSILDEISRQTDSQPKTHKQVGCLLSSAIACILAKATGKPVTIQNETRNQETKTTKIEYQILEYEIFEGETMQLPSLTVSDARLNDGEVQSSVSGDSDLNILAIEIDPNALNYLKKNGDVFILTDVENPQYSHYRIKGYDADAKLIIKFVEFAEVCKTYPDSQTNINNPRTEFTTRIFDVPSPADLKHYDLAFYVLKSGFSTVDDWLKTLKDADKIPECSTGYNKLFFVYHIQRAALSRY
jgi:hypothetical protein